MKKFFSCTFLFFLLISCKYDEIKQNKKFTFGVIDNYSKHYRSYAFFPEYSYTVNGVKYKGSHSDAFEMSFWKSYENKWFPVVYSSKNPQKSFILIKPKDFESWGLEFPDSLNWVKDKIGF